MIAWLAVAYLLFAYFFVPIVWQGIEVSNRALGDRPQITRTSDGHPGDPINVSLVAYSPNFPESSDGMCLRKT